MKITNGSRMIREIDPADKAPIISLAEQLEMFDSQGLHQIEQTLAEFLADNSRDLWFAADDHGIAGVIYSAPEAMTTGTWNVLMLLVSPEAHGQGIGRALMAAVERALSDQGARLLIVETSGLDEFKRARDFYVRLGFTQEARISDFYAAGEDKLVFTKALNLG